MHPDILKLIDLQALDLEAKRLRDEMAALPKVVAGLAQKSAATQGQRAVVLDLIAKEEALRRSQESDVKDHTAKIARIRKQLDLATDTVQVTAFEHQIDFAKAQISKLEDAELESMERTEALDKQRGVADSAVQETAAMHSSERSRAVQTIDKDKLLLAEVEKKREAARPGINEALLSNYDRIARGKGTGLAEALNQKCMACQMLLRPQKWNDLRDRAIEEAMPTCESCGRLLYYDPARDSPQRKTVAVESIAASIVRSL